MENKIISACDLGCGWSATTYTDGSMTIRNCEIGLRSDLPPESVKTLRKAFNSAVSPSREEG